MILHNCRFYACNEDEEKNNGALGISAVVTLKFLQSFLSCPSTPLFPVISKLNYKLNTIIFSSKKKKKKISMPEDKNGVDSLTLLENDLV